METHCERFRYAGVHPDGVSRLCECGLKYDEHRREAQAVESSASRSSIRVPESSGGGAPGRERGQFVAASAEDAATSSARSGCPTCGKPLDENHGKDDGCTSDECPRCGFLHAHDRACEDRSPGLFRAFGAVA